MAVSAPVSFAQGVDEPTQLRIMGTEVPHQMRVMWTSGLPGQPPLVKCGRAPDALDTLVSGRSSTYSVDDLCESPEPAENGEWIAPGFQHSVILQLRDLGFAVRVFLVLCAGVCVCVCVFVCVFVCVCWLCSCRCCVSLTHVFVHAGRGLGVLRCVCLQ